MSYANLVSELQKKSYTWIVTGAAGFIGSNLVERLMELNQKVIGVDNFATGLKKNIEILHGLGKFEFIQGDITDPNLYSTLFQSADYVLHQAALGSVPRSIAEPKIFHAANVDGFFKILSAAHEAKVRKFVYASSSSVYGDNPKLPKVEDSIGKPLSPYAATKLIDEIYAQAYFNSYQAPVVGLRYFNVFGNRQDPNGAYAAVIPLWIKSMLDKTDVFINGDGLYTRDFCYIENVVQANLLAAMSDSKADGEAFNVAVGDRTTLLDLFKLMKSAVEELTGTKVAEPVFREFRKGDIPHSLASIEKATKLIGYKPSITAREGLKETVKLYIKARS